jgi:hypothetical protein
MATSTVRHLPGGITVEQLADDLFVISLELTVDYDISIEEAASRLNLKNADQRLTSENFPAKKRGKETFIAKFVNFRRKLEEIEALSLLLKMDLHPEGVRALIAAYELHPIVFPGSFPTVAIGSCKNFGFGSECATLANEEGEDCLNLYGGSWDPAWWFVAR